MTTSFLGVPIEGTITWGDKRKNQRPMSDLEPMFAPLLASPDVHDFGWHQYTPYFNDGDPCVFSAGGFWVRTNRDLEPKLPEDWLLKSLQLFFKHVAEEYGPLPDQQKVDVLNAVHALGLEPEIEEDDEDLGYDERYGVEYGHPTLGEMKTAWIDGKRTITGSTSKNPELLLACYNLSEAIGDGEFDDALLSTFGDHCEVLVHKDKIVVEHYEHD